ncbi:transglutaminase-like domain-containing protein [Tahibacter soli]|uniref:Transglutaminase-like domain-containing protein n=1 Tax=Tahibacter soli TaxID=2983605 RepID=A0A9X3YM52_9GAMM|nr:transglutaminase-like domain-containing protein [Tahibacter soli]MDC8013775.1 transglutaminase-like domain-containing protein [Tahibacter soli]
MLARYCGGLLFLCAASASAEPQWFAVLIDGDKAGHAQMRRDIADGRTIDTTRVEIELQGADRANRLVLEQRFESGVDGAPLAYAFALRTHDVTRGKTATVDGGAIALDIDEQGIVRRERVALPSGVTWPLAEAALLHDAIAQPGRTLALTGFDTNDDAAVPVELRIGERRAIDVGGVGVVATQVVRTTRKGDKVSTTTSWLDDGLRPLRVEMRVAGVALDLVAATRDVALAPNRSVDFIKRLFVRSPYRIPPSAQSQRIRYVLAHTDGAFDVPSTGEQRVRANGDTVSIDICATCGDEPRIDVAPTETRAPNARIESDAREFADAVRTVGAVADPRRHMLALEDYARRHLVGINGFLGAGSALATARSGQGDCVAYALYLAALGRAAGIPTRVAGGMVYSQRYAGRGDVFVPHAWTQALIGGRWVSFDAATAGFDATHVALVVGQGDRAAFAAAMGRLAKLQIRSIAQVAQRASSVLSD